MKNEFLNDCLEEKLNVNHPEVVIIDKYEIHLISLIKQSMGRSKRGKIEIAIFISFFATMGLEQNKADPTI